MSRFHRLKPTSSGVSCLHVKLPPVRWFRFTMHESQFLGNNDDWFPWIYTWKTILLASGVPHDDSTTPARFLLSKHDDHGLAVLLRMTITADQVAESEILDCVRGKPIFSWVFETWGVDSEIEIVYPSQLSKEEAAKFYVRGKPLEVVEYEFVEREAVEDEVEAETEQ